MQEKRKQKKTLWLGLGMLALLVLAALLRPLIWPVVPLAQDLINFLKAPGTPGHPL